MNFKIAKNRTLCIDLTESSAEEIILVIGTVISVCNLMEDAGHDVKIKVKEENVFTHKEYARKAN